VSDLPSWMGRLFFWLGRSLYIGPAGTTDVHAHHALQIALALDGVLRVRDPEQDAWVSADFIAVRPDAPHQLDHDGRLLGLLYVDPELHGLKAGSLPAVSAVRGEGPGLREGLLACWRGDSGVDEARRWSDAIQRLALPEAQTRNATRSDPRVALVVEAIQAAGGHTPGLTALAQSAGLSRSRLGHLFREEVGLSITRYALWVRLCIGVESLGSGRGVSEAAHAAGFADHAHFTRTFRRMFGVAPAQIAAGEFVKVEPLFDPPCAPAAEQKR